MVNTFREPMPNENPAQNNWWGILFTNGKTGGVYPGDAAIRIAQRAGPSLARLIASELASLDACAVVGGRQGPSFKEADLFGFVSKQIVSHVRY